MMDWIAILIACTALVVSFVGFLLLCAFASASRELSDAAEGFCESTDKVVRSLERRIRKLERCDRGNE